MTGFPSRLATCGAVILFGLLTVCTAVRAQDVPVEKVFAAVPFDQWVRQGPQAPLPWKVKVQLDGLSVHQRLQAHIDMELQGKDLAARPQGDRIIAFIQINDAAGHAFRDYSFFSLKNIPPQFKKQKAVLDWNFFIVPGEYKVTVALFDGLSREHNLMESSLHIGPVKDDPLPDSWKGLPAVEFMRRPVAPVDVPDELFQPDVTGKLHLPLVTKSPVRLELLADVTASNLFRGSERFYNRYLSVALPLLKALSQINLEHGSLSVAMLDLRSRRVTFEQDNVKDLDWPRARAVLAPENGPFTIDIKALEQRRESPAFLQDELLRRLNTPHGQIQEREPFHVFVIIGSPMDFYSFRD
ncbi:MAG TPA: hypothetical protein VKU42_07240, partial [Candidatus Angelobacter sp.]|nr:hypothetical protein [Candidatus Angelobacter sp.]